MPQIVPLFAGNLPLLVQDKTFVLHNRHIRKKIMAVPLFILKNPKAKGETLIHLLVNIKNERVKFSTGQKIKPEHWNKTTQRPDTSQAATDKILLRKLQDIDFFLSRFSVKVQETEKLCKLQKIAFTPEFLKSELEKEFRPKAPYKEPKPKIDFLQFIDESIASARFAKNSKPPRPISPLTIKKFRIAQKHLINYVALKKNGKATFDQINKDFYEGFIQYLQTDLNQASNTIGKNVGVFLKFLHEAREKGLVKDNKELRSLKEFKEDVFNIYLTEDDLNAIYLTDLSHYPGHEKIRDLFIIGCRTALRFSDFTRIRKTDILTTENGEVLQIKQTKTRKDVFIPLHPQAKSIIQKYDYILPRRISNQRTNEYLKKIGELCHLNDQVKKSKTKGGIMIETIHQKWELLTTHTARRTGATLMYKAGIPAISIMKITGHKTEASFLKYIKLSDKEHAELMLKHPYFSNRQ